MSERTVVGRLWAWGVVVVAGLLVLALVAGLSLFPRLGAGQDVIDGLEPAFTPERVAGDVAGISMVSAIVDLADPITTAAGGAAAEVPALVGFVAAQTGLTEAEVLAALAENFPHTTALLQAIPLEDVTAEVPELVAFLADTLGVSPDDVAAALDANFPRLAQSIAALPVVTNGWEDVAAEFPDAGPLTRFDGTDVTTVPDLRDYFAGDVVAAVAAVADDFRTLESTWPPVDLIPWILLAIGVVVLVFGLLMLVVTWKVPPSRKVDVAAWSVVLAVGVLVLGLVAALQLYPRLDAGQEVLDGARPAFTPERVAGDVAGISMVSTIVDLADPITTAAGGAAAEVPALVGFVADQTNLTEAEVLAALAENFPHTTALLQAIPLEDVTAEVPELVAFLADTLGVSPDDVAAALDANFPRLAQSIAALPVVTNGWEDVAAEFPDAGPLTRFDGTDVASVPDLRDYFAGDVVAAVAAVADDFDELDGTAPQVNWFPFLLTVLGAIVVTYGLAMLLIVRRPLVPPFPEVAV